MRRWGRILLAVVVGLLVLWLVFSLGGSYDTSPRSRVASAGAPDWTKPCRRVGSAWRACARVHGRVIVALRRHGDEGSDRHIVVDAGFRPRVILLKARGRHVDTPGPGSKITAVGPVTRGASGRDVVTVATVDH
jgi:hypothetical protein